MRWRAQWAEGEGHHVVGQLVQQRLDQLSVRQEAAQLIGAQPHVDARLVRARARLGVRLRLRLRARLVRARARLGVRVRLRLRARLVRARLTVRVRLRLRARLVRADPNPNPRPGAPRGWCCIPGDTCPERASCVPAGRRAGPSRRARPPG